MGRGDSTNDGSAAGRSIDLNISHLPEDGGTGRCGCSRQSLNPSCDQGPRRLSGDTDSRLLDAKEEAEEGSEVLGLFELFEQNHSCFLPRLICLQWCLQGSLFSHPWAQELL